MKPVDGVDGLVAPNANGAGFGASAFVVGVFEVVADAPKLKLGFGRLPVEEVFPNILT